MANNLTDARRSLVRSQEAAQKRLAELEAERRNVKASLRSLAAALKALEKSQRNRDAGPPESAPAGEAIRTDGA